MVKTRLHAVPSFDPHFDSVVLLLPLDGADTDTSTTDLSNDARTVTFGGAAELDSAQAKFGTTSLVVVESTADDVNVPNHADLIPDVAYTIEAHVRFNVDDAVNTQSIVGNRTTGTQHGWMLFKDPTSDKLRFIGWNNNVTVINITGTITSLSVDTWYHVAAVRDNSGNWELFVNGNSEVTDTESDVITNTTNPFYVGRDITLSTRYLDGWIENVRLTRGVARYSGSFVPPRGAYPLGLSPQPSWDNVIYQTNFEGTDGNVIAQADDKDATNWTSGGSINPVYDDAVTKFGTTSCRYDAGSNGFTGVAADGGGLEDINTQDFMVEQFVNYEDVSSDRAFAGVWHTGTSVQWRWYYDQSAGAIVFGGSTAGTLGSEVQVSVSWSPSTSVWYHAAVSREGTTLRFFIDGQQVGSNQSFSTDIWYNTVRSYLSGTNNDGAAVMDGWIESPRFVIGEAVYTSNFNPPTSHHPIG